MEFSKALLRRLNNLEEYVGRVKEIIEEVRLHGDLGLKRLTEVFDGVKIENIVVLEGELRELSDMLSDSVKVAIDTIYEHLVRVNKSFIPKDNLIELGSLKLGIIWKPLEKVGIYVPGGQRPYPSTLLMAGIPAKVVDVSRLYVATPPRKDGSVDPAIAYTSLKLGVSKVYRVGGAQAIAAMAYGTESVDRVDKVVGPGNIYVQIAKYLLSNVVAIDGFEGPTELVIIADHSADPHEVLHDMMAQAEHSGSTIVLITTSNELVRRVKELLNDDLSKYMFIVVNDVDEAFKLANEIAPEHLSLHVESPTNLLNRVRNAGAISLGRTPPAIIDYLGPNHVLPTNGWARSKGGLTVYDFLKPIIVAYGDPPKDLLRAAMALAEYEGFTEHARSLGVRCGSS